MAADYYDAYKRHLNDAEYLYNDSRFPNADQLYGYSAECGLKCLMKEIFSMPFDFSENMPSKKKDKVHIDKIWDRYEVYRSGTGITEYSLSTTNPFDDWSIDNRYEPGTTFTQLYTDKHRTGAFNVKTLIKKAILDGRLSL